MPVGPTYVSPADALAAIVAYFEQLSADRVEFKAWAGGVVDGGPGLDGDYPLTDYTEDTQLVPCPAKIAATVELTMETLVTRTYPDWATLDLVTAGSSFMVAVVVEDAGTHEDPVTALTVPNSGFFALAPLGWTFLCGLPANQVDDDETLIDNSTTMAPSQRAVKLYVADAVQNQARIMGEIDCSTNPNYPAADPGEMYVISVDGLIGGALGVYVQEGTLLICHTTAVSGNHATVGASWYVIADRQIPPWALHAGKFLKASTTGDALEWAFALAAPDYTGQAGKVLLVNSTEDGVETGDVPVAHAAIVTDATTTRTLSLTDDNKYIRLTAGGGCAITVPPNADVAFPIATVITFRAATAGAVSLVEGAGVTLNPPGGAAGSLDFAEEGATVQIKKIGTNTWDVIGGTAAA